MDPVLSQCPPAWVHSGDACAKPIIDARGSHLRRACFPCCFLTWALISSAKSEESPLIIDNAPRASEIAKKHDKKDGHQGFSDYQRHKLVYLECHSAASRCRTTRVALRF